MTLNFAPYDQEFVDKVRNGGPDANGQIAERTFARGDANPCRSCLHHVAEGNEMLVLAARPFPEMQPYAELGPIFLCADACEPWHGAAVPPILKSSPEYLVKGYSADNRIVYGTGRIVAKDQLQDHTCEILAKNDVAYVDVRSSRNNCFLTRITSEIP